MLLIFVVSAKGLENSVLLKIMESRVTFKD